jgi:hypothetical protein
MDAREQSTGVSMLWPTCAWVVALLSVEAVLGCGGLSRREVAGTSESGSASGGTAGSSLGAGAVSGASHDAEADEFPHRFALTVCGAGAECCERAGLTYAPAECLDSMREQARASLPVADALLLQYRPEQAALCLEEIARLLTSCQTALLGNSTCLACATEVAQIPYCASTFAGAAEHGAPCTSDADCAPRSDGVTSCASNVCWSARFGGGLGDACGGQCEELDCNVWPWSPHSEPWLCDRTLGLTCDDTRWVCVDEPELPGPGEPCDSRGRCRLDAFCTEEGTCIPARRGPLEAYADCPQGTRSECLADARCAFDDSTGACLSRLPCETLPMETTDQTESLCEPPCGWDGERKGCYPARCEAWTTESDCVASAFGCVWNNDLCRSTVCETYLSLDSCPSECEWSARFDGCRAVKTAPALCAGHGASFDDNYSACTFRFPVDPEEAEEIRSEVSDCDD